MGAKIDEESIKSEVGKSMRKMMQNGCPRAGPGRETVVKPGSQRQSTYQQDYLLII